MPSDRVEWLIKLAIIDVMSSGEPMTPTEIAARLSEHLGKNVLPQHIFYHLKFLVGIGAVCSNGNGKYRLREDTPIYCWRGNVVLKTEMGPMVALCRYQAECDRKNPERKPELCILRKKMEKEGVIRFVLTRPEKPIRVDGRDAEGE